jgi:hypothetical protein
MASESPVTVAYWSIRGLGKYDDNFFFMNPELSIQSNQFLSSIGAPLRMMVMYSGRPLNCICYDYSVAADGSFEGNSWFSVKNSVKSVNPLINLPYVIDGKMIITQSNACFLYLGRKLSMLGKNEEEQSYCEQLLCEVRVFESLDSIFLAFFFLLIPSEFSLWT